VAWEAAFRDVMVQTSEQQRPQGRQAMGKRPILRQSPLGAKGGAPTGGAGCDGILLVGTLCL